MTTRRRFLRGAAGAMAIGATAVSGSRVLGASDRVRVALVGCGGRGRFVAGLMRQVEGVEFVAACDVYQARAESAKKWAGDGSDSCGDFRKVLDRKDVDAVLIATPDHWHATIAVLACRAGKDVYVEKPLAHNVREGRAVVEAARKYNRVVQVGTQQRSAPHYREIARIVHGGEIGPVHFVRIWNYMNLWPNGIGKAEDSDPPPGVDWDMYLGPAPLRPFNKNRFVSTFRWFWDYAGGMATDWGTHRFDSMHEIMGADAPLTISAAGRRYELNDGAETPDFLQITYEYPQFTVSYEASNINAFGAGGRLAAKTYYKSSGAGYDRPNGEAFYGTKGTIVSDRVGYELYREPAVLARQGKAVSAEYLKPTVVAAEDATAVHVRNFIDCVRSRQRPSADVEIGHRSSIVPHLGNIAYRTGRKIRWDADREQIVGDPDAAKLLSREARKPWDLI